MLLPALLMAVLVWAIRPALNLQNELFLFLVQVVAGGLFYWILVATLKLISYSDLTNVLRDEFLSKRFAGKN